jgi:hypothetical protein
MRRRSLVAWSAAWQLLIQENSNASQQSTNRSGTSGGEGSHNLRNPDEQARPVSARRNFHGPKPTWIE